MGQYTDFDKSAYMPSQATQIAARLRTIRNVFSMVSLMLCFCALCLRPDAPQYAEKVKKLRQATTEVYITHSIAPNAHSFALAALSYKKHINTRENKNAPK